MLLRQIVAVPKRIAFWGLRPPRPSLPQLACSSESPPTRGLCSTGGAAMSEEERPTVRVAQGLARGRRVASRAGGSYLSFQGLPYAKPPLGPLRFKDAQPPQPWSGTREATADGSPCTQFDILKRSYLGTEDCLYLNVFTPRLPPDGPPMPVMVWIHGGGFIYGSASTKAYGPDFLLAEDVVVVSINYRLGAFGFLFLNHPAAPGNVGLKDQVAALRWVQKNIAAFGGDPGNVTIFGLSSGGAAVHFHLLSPMSKGLFHRAIAMSGVVMNQWVHQYRPEETTRRLGRVLGCPSEDPEEIVNFLRGVDHLELVKAATEDAPFPEAKSSLLAYTFVPTPELAVPGVETFLPAPAKQLLDEGRHHAVPLLIGVVSQEGMFALLLADFTQPDVAAKADSKWYRMMLFELGIAPDNPRAAEMMKDLRDFFMAGKPLGKDNIPGFLEMGSDVTVVGGVDYTVRRMAQVNKAPIYFYNFSVDSELNRLKCPAGLNYPGACHGDDLGYLFRMAHLDPDLPDDSEAAVARRRMVRLWTNFAKTGNPTPAEDPLLGARWPPYSERERAYLEIGAELRPGADLNPERAQFWQRFYRKYSAEIGNVPERRARL